MKEIPYFYIPSAALTIQGLEKNDKLDLEFRTTFVQKLKNLTSPA